MNSYFCGSCYDGMIPILPLQWQVPLFLHRDVFIVGVIVIRNDLFWTHRSAFVELPPTDSNSRSESTQRRPDSFSTSKLYNSLEACHWMILEVVFIASDGYFGDSEILGAWEQIIPVMFFECYLKGQCRLSLSTPSIVIWFIYFYAKMCVNMYVAACV